MKINKPEKIRGLSTTSNNKPEKIRGLSTTTNINQPDNQQLSRLKQDSFRHMMTVRLEMIITLQNMQLQQTLRNVTLAEENLTRKLWKSMKKFAKKFL
jgi:hypothetical protein